MRERGWGRIILTRLRQEVQEEERGGKVKRSNLARREVRGREKGLEGCHPD